jgi:microcystin degradation protein MlrC
MEDKLMTELISRFKEMEAEEGIFKVSLNAGFAFADVSFVGPSVTITYKECAIVRTQKVAKELEEAIWQLRDRVNDQCLIPD